MMGGILTLLYFGIWFAWSWTVQWELGMVVQGAIFLWVLGMLSRIWLKRVSNNPRGEAGALIAFLDSLPGAASQAPTFSETAHARVAAEALEFASKFGGAKRVEAKTDEQVVKRLRTRFVGALGHDVGNPLNSITGFSDMLLTAPEHTLNDEQRRSVRTIRASAEQLSRLMSSIVNEAKLDSGTLRLQEQWIDPSEILEQVQRHLGVRAFDRAVDIETQDGLPRVFVDRTQTIHALVSLVMLVLESVGTDIQLKVALPRWEKSKAVQFDLIANFDDDALGSLGVVERLERDAGSVDPLGLEVFVARRVLEQQGARLWTETGTAGGLRICLTLPA